MSAATDEAQPVFAPASRIGGGVSIARGTDRVGPLLDTATTRLKTNDLDLAAAAYAEVLHLAPTNVDALIGLATISLRRGQTGSAERFYLQALEADPKNVSAQVGAIGLRHQADPVAAESRLKLLISANAEHPSPQFALGNVYAAQQRWAEAQQAYFNAFSRDSDNPDYAYNLAVSLDHLHQERLALKYYKLALGAATGRYGGFDAGRVAARIAEIQP
jgi:tetratricopeptide (TPR) repeat protein